MSILKPINSFNGDYLKRFCLNTVKYLGSTIRDVALLRPYEKTPDEKTLFDCTVPQPLDAWRLGSDQDIGGFSTARLNITSENKLRFHGNISLALKPESDAVYTGYTALRSSQRFPQHLFDNRYIDCSKWLYLIMRVRGDHRTYSVNFKPGRSFAGDLYSCRFKFLDPYQWEEVIVPFEFFVRTNCGEEYIRQYAPNMERIHSFGFLLADNLPGPFNLEIDWIKVSNLGFKYLNNDNEADNAFLTKHLLFPEKKRETYSDSMANNLGIGFDLGDRVIESVRQQKRQRPVNPYPDRVHESFWDISVVRDDEDSVSKKKRSSG